MRISDWSSDVCSSDLAVAGEQRADAVQAVLQDLHLDARGAALQGRTDILCEDGHDSFPLDDMGGRRQAAIGRQDAGLLQWEGRGREPAPQRRCGVSLPWRTTPPPRRGGARTG